MKIDLDLLRRQIEFLDRYNWHQEKDRDFAEGIISLLEATLDDNEDLDRCSRGMCVCSEEEKARNDELWEESRKFEREDN